METRKDVRPCFGGTFGRLWLVGAGELPFLRELLHTEPLTGLDLLVLFLASTLGSLPVRLDRIMFRPIQRRFEAGPGDPDLRGRPKSRLGGPSSPYQAGRWTTLSLPAGPA